MHPRHPMLCLVLVAAAVAVPRPAPPQQSSSASPPAAAPTGAASACPALTFTSLEDSPGLVTEAANLAAQMVGNYNPHSEQNAPDISSSWVSFNKALLEAMKPDCSSSPLAQKAATQTAITKATTGQTNTQTGAPGSGSGATSPAQKVGIPQLLAFAVENGAIADSVSGTTMTLSTTPYGFVYAFARNADTADRYQSDAVLTHTGISATFNVADTANPLQSASRKAISQWQLKYTFRDTSTRSLAVNCMYLFENSKCGKHSDLNRAPTSKLYAAANAVVKGLSDKRFLMIRTSLQTPENEVYKNAWMAALQKLVAAPPAASDTDQSKKQGSIGNALLQLLDNDPAFQSAIRIWSEEFAGDSSNLAVFVKRLEANDAAYAAAQAKFEADVKNLTKGWNGDFAFSEKFPSPTTTSGTSSASSSTTVSPPACLASELDITFDPKTDTSKAASGQSSTSGPKGIPSFTGNFSGSFYPNPNASLHESTFRGGQAAIQFQWSLGGGPFKKVQGAGDDSQMTLSVSGNYQRLQENEDQSKKRPDLVTGNLKLEVPISSGVNFPLAISFGNATSQVKGDYVLGNFGISFNLDALAALAKLKR